VGNILSFRSEIGRDQILPAHYILQNQMQMMQNNVRRDQKASPD
jgi:hypothetical protein